jgi:hypothetical protein
MPPSYVKTVREEIFYEYARLISRSAHGSLQYGFVSDRFKKLRNGQVTISGTMREWEQEQELPRQCVFCGSPTKLSIDHLISRNRGGEDSPDNLVLACTSCNSSRGDKGVFEWLGLKEKDNLPRLVAGNYLKQLLKVHEQAKTIDISVEQMSQLCGICPLPEVCKKWNKVGKLTCFCLESILPWV